MKYFPTTWLAFLWYFIKKQPIAFTFLFIVPYVLVVETTVIPYAFKLVIDAVVENSGNRSAIFHDISFALWLGGGSWLIMCAILHLQHWLQVYTFPKLKADIRMSVLEFTINHSYQYFYNNLAGNIGNKINDLQRISIDILDQIRWNIITFLATFIASVIMLITINPLFALILAMWVTIHMSVILLLAPYVNRAAQVNAEDDSQINGTIIDMLSNIISIKLFTNRHNNLNFINHKQKKEIKSHAKLINMTRMFNISMDIFVVITFATTVYFLIACWQQGELSTGDLAFIFQVFFMLVDKMFNFGHRLRDLFKDIGVVQQAITLINKPYDTVDIDGAKPLLVKKGEIIFNEVTFAYHANEDIFTDKNITIKSRIKVGLVGFSGGGKTTFVNLILRLFDVKSGKITIDGQDIATVTQDSLHANISMIPQDTSLFHRSLMENIRYGNVNASDAEVISVAKRSYCHEFISQLPEGYESLVGERALNYLVDNGNA